MSKFQKTFAIVLIVIGYLWGAVQLVASEPFDAYIQLVTTYALQVVALLYLGEEGKSS